MISAAPSPTDALQGVPVEATSPPQAVTPQTAQDEPTHKASDELEPMIAEAAYYIAERRGFEPGHDVDDWLQAQAEVMDRLAQQAL